MQANRYLEITWALGAAATVTLAGGSAFAGFWTPLDTVPAPNFIIGMDYSVTMGIRSDCSSCHGPSNPNTRLNEAKTDILATLPMFQNYFVFGGYKYAGCGSAHIQSGSRVLPTPTNPPASYAAVRAMINGAGHCGSRENNFPGAGGGTGCITPTPACVGDQPVLNTLMASGLPGLNIPAPTIPNPNVNIACDTPSPPWPSYNLAASLISKFSGFGWPRWDPASLNAAQVNNELCTPLSNVLNQVSAELSACFTNTSSVWDMSFLGGGVGTWCTPGTIANNACVPGSPLDATCVCDDTLPGCASSAIPSTECSKVMTWKARQQVGVCEMYSTAQPNRFGSYFLSQTDNIANGQCRENVGIFITDGYEGHRAGVAAEGLDAQTFYRSADGLSNMFVFRISSVFNSHANAMQSYVSSTQAGGPTTTAYAATDRATMQESFAKVLSRIYKGVYTGANMGMDRYQTRAVFHSFTVPGYHSTGPVSDDYLGFPSRISVHEVLPDGTILPNPRFESDWNSRVGASPGCGGYTLRGQSGVPGYSMGGVDTAAIGPNGQFTNGVDRSVFVPANSTDRDGDDIPDAHPSLRYGRSYGFAAGAALVVDAPEEALIATSSAEIAAMQSFQSDPAIQQRPRVIYYTDGGYLIGIHGGTYQGSPQTYGNQTLAFWYDDSSTPAGAEVLRYQPSWLDPSQPANAGLSYNYDYGANPLIQQPLMTGELIAKEILVRVGGSEEFRTVLVSNQGKEGPGFFAIDVTDPCSPPAFATDIRLPGGNYASAEPTLYLLPRSAAPRRRAALVTVGGLNGTNRIFAYDIVTGGLLASRSLPGGASYATAPVCVDVTGEGTVTHCYALREDGFLARVEVVLDGFGPVVDVTPVDAGGNRPSMTSGRRYYTSPVAYFGQDGTVNLVFGSGDYQNLTSAAAPNAVFRAKDLATRQQGVPAGNARLDQVCLPDGGGNTDGVIALGAGERVLSKPVVQEGVVAWTTYVSSTSGCISGNGLVYAMDFETCEDVIAPGSARPTGNSTGAGIPTSPVLHSQSESVLVQSSAGPTGGQVQTDAATTRGGGTKWIKPLYWRMAVDNP